MDLASIKQLRKCASDTVIQVRQRGAKAEDMGEGVCPGKTHRILLDYNLMRIPQLPVSVLEGIHWLPSVGTSPNKGRGGGGKTPY